MRAGERSRHARRFADASVVALGWPNIPGLGDLRGRDVEELVALLAISGMVGTPKADAAELLAFRDDLRRGDIVVTPDAPARQLLVGEVVGAYDYRDPSPAGDYRHVRDVRWWGRVDRGALPGPLDRETHWRRSIRRLAQQEAWREVAASLPRQ